MKKLLWVVSVSCLMLITGLVPLSLGSSIERQPSILGRFSEEPGWPLVLNITVLGPPAVADMNGDGAMEMVFGSDDGLVYAVHADGTIMSGWPVSVGEMSGDLPCIGDINHDNVSEVLVEGFNTLYAFTPAGVSVPGWPISMPSSVLMRRPMVADVDGDGVQDVIVAGTDLYSYDGRVYAFDGSGSALPGAWPFFINGTSFPGLCAVGDINADGQEEIAIGTNHGLYVIDHQGFTLSCWPEEIDRTFQDPCTLADLNRDGRLEIIATSESNGFGTVIYKYDGRKVTEVSNMTWYRKEVVPANIVGNDDLEIIGVTDGHVNAYYRNGSIVPGWPVSFIGGISCTEGTGEPSVVAEDVDHDGYNEVVFCSRINDTCRFYAWNGDGSLVNGFPFEADNHGVRFVQDGAVAVADINHDSSLELISVSSDDLSHHKSIIHVYDLGVEVSQSAGWPQFHHDAAHTGSVPGVADVEPPVVKMVWPTPGLYVKNSLVLPLLHRIVAIGPIEIRVNATDNMSGIAQVAFYLDQNTDPVWVDKSAPYNYTWSKPAFFRHIITAMAFDNAGNWAQSHLIIDKFF